MNKWLLYSEGKNQYIYYVMDYNKGLSIMIHSPGGSIRPQLSVSRVNIEFLKSKAKVLHETKNMRFYPGLFVILFAGIITPDDLEHIALRNGFEGIEDIFGEIK